MRIITRCMKPTPHISFLHSQKLPPAKPRKNYVTYKISYHAWANEEHPLHCLVLDPQSLCPQHLKSHHPFYHQAAKQYNCNHNITEAWNKECTKRQCPKQLTLTSDLPQKLWVTQNCLKSFSDAVWCRNAQIESDLKPQPHAHVELLPKMQSTSSLIATPLRISLT